MRTIEPTARFRMDIKREKKGKYRATLDVDSWPVINQLARDEALSTRYRDHALTGDSRAHRDCHIQPDLVLIERKTDADTLQLVRLGSHSELRL